MEFCSGLCGLENYFMRGCFLSQNAEQAHFTSQEAKDAYSRMIRKKKGERGLVLSASDE